MVEPVMGFCTEREHHKFLKDAPAFEKMIVDEGIKLFKFYFSVSKDEQEKRFKSRENDPLKQYKISPIDEKAQEMWDAYTVAKYSMLFSSNTPHAPWSVVRSDDKKKARINAIKHILQNVEYPDKIEDSYLVADDTVLYSGEQEVSRMEDNLEDAL
jgi:polyphosphate kinase 2 (PPK2 family)